MIKQVRTISKKQAKRWETISNLISAIDDLPGGFSIVCDLGLHTCKEIQGLECTEYEYDAIVGNLAFLLKNMSEINGLIVDKHSFLNRLGKDLAEVYVTSYVSQDEPNLVSLK